MEETFSGVTAFRPSLKWRLGQLWARLFPRPSNLEIFARDELRRAGYFGENSDYGGMMGEAIMKLVREFDKEGHSGFSAQMAIGLFQKVARFEPLTPLTGADDEWNEIGDGEHQNRRCSHVFKNADGAYDSTGRIFREPDGCCYQSCESRVQITFPYTPTIEYVDRPSGAA